MWRLMGLVFNFFTKVLFHTFLHLTCFNKQDFFFAILIALLIKQEKAADIQMLHCRGLTPLNSPGPIITHPTLLLYIVLVDTVSSFQGDLSASKADMKRICHYSDGNTDQNKQIDLETALRNSFKVS